MVSLRGRGYTRLCLSAALSDWLGSRGVCVSRMWALEESASAQSAARSHTDAVLQHGIKTLGHCTFSSYSSNEREAIQNVSKVFHEHICCLEREWPSVHPHKGLCAVAMLRGFRHLQSQPHITSHRQLMPTPLSSLSNTISAHKRLCLDQTEHYTQQGHSHCFELRCLLNIFVFLSVLIEAFIK